MKLARIAEALGCSVPDDAAGREITGIASLESAGIESVSFVSDSKLEASARASRAPALIVKKGHPVEGKLNLEVDDPYVGYAKVAVLFEDTSPPFGPSVHASAIVDQSARVDPTACIGPGTVVGADVSIGARTVVGANCVLEKGTSVGTECRIDSGVILRCRTCVGNRVTVQSGTVVGSDGFANAMENGTWLRIPCFGNVVIEDDVQIGACVTIDRGNFGPTVIRRGARLDNLIHIAHNVEVGADSAMAAQAGVSGSTKIGKRVLIGGQAGFVGHIEIGDGAFVGAKAGVSKSVEPGSKVTGYPARDLMKMRRIEAAEQELPAMIRQVKDLRKRIELLEKDLSRKE